MSQRPSEQILTWLRASMKEKDVNVAALAQRVDEKRGTVRRVLSGKEPLTVDQLVQWTQALELSLEDLMSMPADLPEAPAPAAPPQRLRSVAAAVVPPMDEEPDPFTIDPYALQAEQAIRIAFALGVNFTFVLDATQLDESSGVPDSVRGRFPERMPIQLDAAYHRFNEPEYDERGVGLTLSFGGTKHRSFFPWSAVLQVVYFVEPPEPEPTPEEEEDEAPSGRPTLRLVK
ncbi:MAG: helix-turn-helix domain-containing protein [Alphaproteobacteria bacterium]|nr:helix-turn-helix domain-containing protein [Alphaproteobacteria bacterium]MCB9796880.1 helix-turn-helix domain-containing protein [Alphaproteobacteria bacterium]